VVAYFNFENIYGMDASVYGKHNLEYDSSVFEKLIPSFQGKDQSIHLIIILYRVWFLLGA
jgi:hypothetical protein